jgi:hypothetical protein
MRAGQNKVFTKIVYYVTTEKITVVGVPLCYIKRADLFNDAYETACYIVSNGRMILNYELGAKWSMRKVAKPLIQNSWYPGSGKHYIKGKGVDELHSQSATLSDRQVCG